MTTRSYRYLLLAIPLAIAACNSDRGPKMLFDGLTEELITDLYGVNALRITSRNSSMQLKTSTKSPREIGRTPGS